MATADTARLIASLELQDKFSATAAKYDRAIGQMEAKTSTFGRISGEASRGLGNLATNVARIGVFAGGAAVVGITKSIQAASDLNEEIDKSKVVFGAASDEVIKFAEGAASIGLAKAEALGAAGAFGNMFRTTGIAESEAAEMSNTMVQLAADMASFNNEDPSEMLDKLRSGLSGEAEPLRRFGVLLSEATLKTFAYENGIAKTGEALTEAQKVQARYGLILEQSAIQQGNFADTSSSLANQQRTLRANLQNTSATIGQALLPQVGKLVQRFNDLVMDKQPEIQAFAAQLPAVFERVESLISNLPWGAMGSAFQLMGAGANVLLGAFTSMPPWVQTAVLTGWGLNKLTGGTLGNIVGALGSGLIKGVLGMNAGVVNINAATVNGGPGGIPGGKGGGFLGSLGRGLGTGLAVGGAAVAVGGAAVAVSNFTDMREQAMGGLQNTLDDMPRKTGAEIDKSMAAIEAQINLERPFLEGILFNTNVKPQLEAELAELREMRFGTDSIDRNMLATAQRLQTVAERNRAIESAVLADTAMLNSVRAATDRLGPRIDRVANTPHTVKTNVDLTIPVNISATVLANQLYRTSTSRSYSAGTSTNTGGI